MPPDEGLLTDQPPLPGESTWRALVDRVLGRADGPSPARAPTGDAPTTARLYTRSGDGHLATGGWPGSEPFTRGARPWSGSRSWDIRQRVDHPDPAVANRDLLDDLERGGTSALLAVRASLDPHADGDGAGILLLDRDDATALLAGVRAEMAPLGLDAGGRCLEAAALLLAGIERTAVPPEKLKGALGVDPLGAGLHGRPLAQGPAASLIRHLIEAWPGLQGLRADGRPWHAAGAGEAQELAATLATAVTYLRLLDDAGVEPAVAAGQVEVVLAADCDIFSTMAKFRALRGLWGRVLHEIDAEAAWRHFHLHAETATRMLTRCDPHVNLLRTTGAAFAAIAGGADSLTVLPFDHALGQPGRHGRRLARNIQLLLMEESQLHRVGDPAGGSWYVENLTRDLMRDAWRLFQEIESAGGMAAALAAGLPQGWAAESWAARARDLATMRQPITGVSAFVAQAEPMRAAADLDDAPPWDRVEARLARARSWSSVDELLAIARGGGVPGPAPTGASIPRLPQHRLAEGFEALRARSDAALDRDGHRPRACIVALGPTATHTARLSFARNILEAGGIEPVSAGPLPSAEAASAAFEAAGTEVALLCSSDEVDSEMAAAVAKALRAAGCRHLVLIGAADPISGPLATLKVDLVIRAGGDMLEALATLQTWLGTPAGRRSEMQP